MSIIKHITLQKIVAHDFWYEPRITKLYTADSYMSDSDLTTHETDEFTEEEEDCEDGVDCITQPLEPNSSVLLKLATKKRVKYFVGVNHKMEPDGYTIRFLYKQFTCWTFCFPEIEDTLSNRSH